MRAKRPNTSKVKRVKAVARKRVGSPKPARVLAERAERIELKHKGTWRDEIDE